MKIKVIIENKSKMELFSFIVSECFIGEFFNDFFGYFENIEDINVHFLKINESEEKNG